MITQSTNNPVTHKKPKAVGLISGGLDSTLAAQIVKDLGVDVYGVYFSMPWGCCDKTKAIEAAQQIGIKFIVLHLDERYLEIVKKPKYGYGSGLNPCVDCRIHMFSRAAQYMQHIGGDFVFTGEVLGQRPMSQMRKSLQWIEEGTGLQGRLLRPLCAKHLEPTIPEQEGLIDRSKLLDLSGRSRKEQYRLAGEFHITQFSPPAGGCLLTDHNFARRIKDTFQYGYRNFRETTALKWGRHFRINESFKLIIGRDEEENESLIRYAHQDDIIMQLMDNLGPTVILKGDQPSTEILSLAAGFLQIFSRYKTEEPQMVKYWPSHNKNHIQYIQASMPSTQQMEQMHI